MNCYLHPDTPASAFCRSCGKALCIVCQRPAEGTIFCQEHIPMSAYPNPAEATATAGPNPYAQTSPPFPATAMHTSPGLAFVLGLIPGVGAIYNGQYLKGLIHAVIFGLLIALANSATHGSEVVFAMGIAAFAFYMPFEAYHTARNRQMGVHVEEFSSIVPPGRYSTRAPVGPIALIVIGVLFLLDTLHLVDFREIGRYWPVLLIVVGAWRLYSRFTSPIAPLPPSSAPPPPYSAAGPAPNDFMETRHE